MTLVVKGFAMDGGIEQRSPKGRVVKVDVTGHDGKDAIPNIVTDRSVIEVPPECTNITSTIMTDISGKRVLSSG